MKSVVVTQAAAGVPAGRPGQARTLRALQAWLHTRFPGFRLDRKRLQPVAARYPVAVTSYYASLIQRPEPSDPIFRQCIPSPAELVNTQDLSPDPLAESRHSPVPGLVHRWPDRCLLLLTNSCFVYCRHCLRKAHWGRSEGRYSRQRVRKMLGYLAGAKAVREAILSGGDPLMLSNRELEFILASLRSVPQVEVIRIHTRAPVVQPARIDSGLLSLLRRFGPIWLNTQFNHPAELTASAAAAVDQILSAGVPVGNQAVLLRGVNDDYATQRALHLGLVRLKVRPYYLFHCDPAEGVGHFRTSVKYGERMVRHLARELSGLAVPHFAWELAGGGGKARRGVVTRRKMP